jgi:hypothetical protein
MKLTAQIILAVVTACVISPAHAAAPCGERSRNSWSMPALGDDVAGELERLGARDTWGLANLSARRDNADAKTIQVRYPAGSINPSNAAAPVGGAGFLLAWPGQRHAQGACLRYKVRFPAGFTFVRGGKLPGLYGGQAPTGGDRARDGSGFTTRFMWRSNGAGEIYAYTLGKSTRYGDSLGRGSFYFSPGRWQVLELEVFVNGPGVADGIIRVWVDSMQVLEKTNVVFRNEAEGAVDGLIFSTFFGGHDPSWASPVDQIVEFRDFSLSLPTTDR